MVIKDLEWHARCSRDNVVVFRHRSLTNWAKKWLVAMVVCPISNNLGCEGHRLCVGCRKDRRL